MRKKEKTRVIWRHPRGRFEIQETEHYSLFDHCTYYTRECVFTPQDDARGLCSEVPTGIFVPAQPTPQKGVQGPVYGRRPMVRMVQSRQKCCGYR